MDVQVTIILAGKLTNKKCQLLMAVYFTCRTYSFSPSLHYIYLSNILDISFCYCICLRLKANPTTQFFALALSPIFHCAWKFTQNLHCWYIVFQKIVWSPNGLAFQNIVTCKI